MDRKLIKFFWIPVAFVIVTSNTAHAQNFTFGTPVRLNDNINSPSEESMPLLSPDGNELFFVRTFYAENTGGKLSGQDIWVSVKNTNGEWSPATNNLPFLNNTQNNAVIGFSKDKKTLYLLNSYQPVSTKIHGIAKSIKIGNEWSQPYEVNIKGLESKNSFIGFYVNPQENVLFISMNNDDSYGEEDLYISLLDSTGRWSKPQNLGATINTSGFEISPFLADDGKTLFFASDGHNGYGGSDIYMSRRLYDSWIIWSKPINLGEKINTTKFEAYLNLYDNKRAYFVSTRQSNFADIYEADVLAVDASEEHAEINKNKYKLTETEIQELLGMPVSRTIYFDYGSYQITEASRELIYFLANKLLDKSEYNIELIGNASQEGSDEYNQQLSEDRAREVAKYFINFGITPNRISTRGVGESHPIVKTGNKDDLAKNRRVEIYFTK